MNRLYLVLIANCSLFFSFTRSTTDQSYQWDETRQRYILTAAEDSISEYILKHHVQYDYIVESDKLVLMSTIHRIVKVNSDEAIQRNNRIYISMGRTMNLVNLKARTIRKDGKVVNFNQSDLKEIVEEEKGTPYKIFAMDGVEVGSEVEYFYTRKMTANLFDRVYLQFEVPVKNSSFKLSCPEHLEFDLKGYNNLPTPEKKTEDKRNVYFVGQENVDRLKKEAFSNYEASRKRVEFKFAYNTARSKARQYTWDEAAKTFYKIMTTRTKEEEKAVQKFLHSLPDNPSWNVSTRITAIERYIKSNIQISEKNNSADLNDIAAIIKYKIGAENGLTKLYLAIMEKKGIECQLVISCSRELVKFDQSFDSWAFLDQYLLYFPKEKNYLSASSFQFRYPFIPSELTSQNALFIEPLEIGDLKTAIPELKEIPALDYTLNIDNLNILVDFNGELSSNRISLTREFGGYNAAFIAPYYEMTTEEQRSNMVKEITKQTAPDASLEKWSLTPSKERTSNIIMQTDFTSSHFIEMAGKRILFKVGELIGPQSELYRDDERKTPVENDFNRGYDRTIIVKIPKGYRIKNPDDLKLDFEYKENDKAPFLFTSTYALKESQLEISIKEYYKQISAPLNRYEDFRKVINAAADFNKITLVFEKVE